MVAKNEGVLLDTNFLIALLGPTAEYYDHACAYLKGFRAAETRLFCSTISIAEFCVKSKMDRLPLEVLTVLPFNLNHAQLTGNYARELFDQRRKTRSTTSKPVIWHDVKLIAQAELEPGISHLATSDKQLLGHLDFLRDKGLCGVSPIDFKVPPDQFFGTLF